MMELENSGVKSCVVLLEQYRQSGNRPLHTEKLTFAGIGGKDVYNITAPFLDDGETVVAGRVESRDSEQSEIVFFVRGGTGDWVPMRDTPVLTLQDPFYTRINGELILGGVETFPHPHREGHLGWRTVFYRGADLRRLNRFFVGPDFMKDLRLVQLTDGRIGVFTRPQGVKGGRGKIGYTTADALDELSLELVAEAPLLEGQFLDEEWGGCNEIHLLSNGLLGVLGHIARFDEHDNRHYYPMVFVFDPRNRAFTDMRIIAERSDFIAGPAKRPDLVDVVFSGGLVRKGDGTADLYAGISDAEAHKITIPDPFLKYER
jgi:hypothetical protein